MNGGRLTSRVTIVEDHGLIAHTVAAALRDRGMTVEVVDPVGHEDLVGAVTGLAPDVVLLDLDLGRAGSALPLVGPLAVTGVPVVMVTGTTDAVQLARCVEAGAAGVLSKDVPFDRLIAAIERTLEHGTLLTKHERDDLLALLREEERAEHQRLGPFEELTPREAEVLAGLLEGRSVTEIAKASVVSVATVRTQVRSILTKLGVSSQLAAIARARAAGWQPPSD